MSPLFFVLCYICVGYLIVNTTWIYTAVVEKKVRLILSARETFFLQSTLNLLHLGSGLFFPLGAEPDIPIRAFGLTLFTLGVWIAIWARVSMGASWNIPGKLNSDQDLLLVKTGPFSYSRNPIYVGIILISFGMAIALKSIFILLGFFLYFHLYLMIREEEKKMQTHFEDSYSSYRLEVPRFI